MTNQTKSKCCGAEYHTNRSEDLGQSEICTTYYICNKCDKACDVTNQTNSYIEEEINKRLWIFIASYDEVPFHSKIFDDYDKLKSYSAEHSSQFNNGTTYNSTYLDLYDKDFIAQALQKQQDIIKECLPDINTKAGDKFDELAAEIIWRYRKQFLDNLKAKGIN